MRQRLLIVAVLPLLLVALSARTSRAQSYEDILAQYPDAQEMTTRHDGVQVLLRPNSGARSGMALQRGEVVLAFDRLGPYTKVATLEEGYVGYVQTSYLERYEEGAVVEAGPPAREPFGGRGPGVRERAARGASFKDPGTATLLSVLIVGGGQFYAGETGRGALLLLSSGVALAVGSALTYSSMMDFSCSDVYCIDNTNWYPLYIGIGISTAAWLFGVADASKSARRMNEAAGFGMLQVRPDVHYADGGLRPSLRLSVLF